jgi:Zn-dependent protease
MQRYMINTRLLAMCICVRWQFFIALPVFCLVTRSALGGVLALQSLIVLMLAHELGHAALARYCGLQVERIELQLLQGSCVFSAPRSEIEAIIVSWGGVMAQLALFIVFEALYHGVQFSSAGSQFLYPIFAVFIAWNAISLAVNLLPIEGVDGHTAWKIVPAIRNGAFMEYVRARRAAAPVTLRARQ